MPELNVAVAPALTVKPNPRNNASMFQIFQNVQYNVVQHKKYVKEMKKLYKKLDEKTFRESFNNALHYLFTFGDTSTNVDRVIQFVATFCTSLDDEEEFLLFIFEIIFDCQCVSGQSVRYRASQLLAAVLSALGDDASLDDDLCDKLLASQMQRLQDTRGAVRCRAALALQRLQNPMEQDDEVTRAYRFHMSCDPSSSVRRAVVMSIAKCTRNVPFVLERLCDVDEAVRRAAFLYIAAINVTQLRVRQRVITLKVGLTERSHRVRRVVEEILIPGWLSTFKGNIIDMLNSIRLDNAHDAQDSQTVAGKLLESLFKRLPISELLEWLPTDKSLRLIPAEKLTKETAWYWRHLAEHLQRIDDDETLETILPDLVVLTGYIKTIVESPCPVESAQPAAFNTRQHVLEELCRLLGVYDAGDAVGRAALQDLVVDVLTGDYGPLSPGVVRSLVLSLEAVLPSVGPRVELLAGVLTALREPPDTEPELDPVRVEDGAAKIERARLRVSLNVAIEAEEEAVREQNYALAEECKAKVKDIQAKLDELNTPVLPPSPPPAPSTIREKISDAVTLNKCLLILNCLLDTPDLTEVTPMLKMIFSELEVEIFQNPEVLETALETVALYGMLDKEFATENKAFFFANLMDTSNERVVCTVLKCIVDLLCVHGAGLFEDDDVSKNESKVGKKKRVAYNLTDDEGSLSESAISMSQGNSTVIELLLKIMDSACSQFRLIIAEGLCRLLHLGHLESPTILSRLLLLWFNPATVDEDMLRQVIGIFFQSFASSVEGAQEQIQKATIPTLRALANAPSSSPISEIDQEAVIRFIVSLTKVNAELYDSQGGLAVLAVSRLSSRVGGESALLCRLLALLGPPRDSAVVADLITSVRDVCTKIQDKQSCRNLTRYLGALEACERLSMNKLSTTGMTDTLMNHPENTLSGIGRMTTSLPQPIARSTHVVVNDTVEEEVEIDETSPTEVISRISEGTEPGPSPVTSSRRESGGEVHSASSDVSPVKKHKVGKGKKKKLSMSRRSSKTEEQKGAKGKEIADKEGEAETEEGEKNGGVKRSRSQRSLVDVERARKQQQAKSSEAEKKVETPEFDLDASNVTVRRSTRGLASSGSSDSAGSSRDRPKGKAQAKKQPKPKATKRKSAKKPPSPRRSATPDSFNDSADETELHTIVYDQENVQSLLNDSSDLESSKITRKSGNVTIPETPEGSEASESEPDTPVVKKVSRNGKNK